MGCARCQKAEFDKQRACPRLGLEVQPSPGIVADWTHCPVQEAQEGIGMLSFAWQSKELGAPCAGGHCDQTPAYVELMLLVARLEARAKSNLEARGAK